MQDKIVLFLRVLFCKKWGVIYTQKHSAVTIFAAAFCLLGTISGGVYKAFLKPILNQNERTKNMKKRLISLFLTLVMLAGIMPAAFAEGGADISVWLSISSYGDPVKDKDGNDFAYLPVDLSGKESYTLDDVFRAAHIAYHPDGESAYASSVGDWGLGLDMLWGDTSYNFGYQVNGGTESVMGLSHEAEDGDYIDACIYKNNYPDTESYSRFDKQSAEAFAGKALSLTLEAVSGYDENWNSVFSACSDAAITINGEETDIVTDEEGKAQITFDEPGKYIVSAKKTKILNEEITTAITAPVCVVSVSENPAITAIHNIAARYAQSGVLNDGNMLWFLADMAVYNELYPETENVLSETEKRACLDKIIAYAESATTPGDLSKAILALRALGYDAKNVYTKDLTKIDVVKKLTDLVDSRTASVTNVYTLPYVIIALLSGENYATEKQMSYLTEAAVTSKTSWQNTRWGTDAATPMMLALSAFYDENEDVKAILDETAEALEALVPVSGLLGGNAASCGLAIAGFAAMGIDPALVANGENTIIDGLLSTANDTNDGFGNQNNSFSTEQGFRGLLAWQALKLSEKRMYDFADYPMDEAHATWAENCPVTFSVIPADATVTIDGSEAVSENNFDLAEGTHTYTIEKSGYITKTGTVTISADEAANHTAKAVRVSLSSAGGSYNEDDNLVTVNIKVMMHDGDECGNSYTYKRNPSKYTAIVNESVEIENGQTVFDVLDAALTNNNIAYIEGSYGYISSIDGVAEFDHGANSGWMFTLNGNHKNTGCRETYIRANSTVVWFYTDDYTNEKGSESYSGGGGSVSSVKEKTEEVSRDINNTAEFILNSVTAPTVASVGGEWAILGLARSSYDVSEEYYAKYYEAAESYVKECEGVLHDKKYTEYARVALALGAIGKNPHNVAGYDLVAPLADFEKVVSQGINGAVWALIALDSKDYEIPEDAEAQVIATRDMYISHILETQLSDGGFPISESLDKANIDITAMAITALSSYKDRDEVKAAIDKALAYLSDNTEMLTSVENIAQVIVALTSCGISPESEDFETDGKNLVDMLYDYYIADGGFAHEKNDKASNLMASEQALYALSAIERFESGKNSLFDMSDVSADLTGTAPAFGLLGKHADIKAAIVTAPGKTFDDIANHESKIYIEALAERGIINGKSETAFDPDAGLTRAELAVLIVRGLGLTASGRDIFLDVSASDWFYSYVASCYDYGIISGVSEKEFNPYGPVTNQEAAAMVQRAAKLCGMVTDMDDEAVRNTLAGFTDYTTAADWAKASLAFCYQSGILSDEEIEIAPASPISRAELSVMLYNLLDCAKLL